MCPFVLFTGRGQEPNAALLHHHNQRQVGSRPVELVRGRCKHSDSDSASAAVGRSAQKLMSYGGEEDDGRGDPARPSGHSPLATRHTHTYAHACDGVRFCPLPRPLSLSLPETKCSPGLCCANQKQLAVAVCSTGVACATNTIKWGCNLDAGISS
jgi:hypothetical protein